MDHHMTVTQATTLANEISLGLVARQFVVHPNSGVLTVNHDWNGRRCAIMIDPDGIISYDGPR